MTLAKGSEGQVQLSVNNILQLFRYYLKKYESVFSGSEFVDWLLERELVSSREEAVEYGHSLLLGRVIAHVANEHYFHDDNYFYRFLE